MAPPRASTATATTASASMDLARRDMESATKSPYSTSKEDTMIKKAKLSSKSRPPNIIDPLSVFLCHIGILTPHAKQLMNVQSLVSSYFFLTSPML